MTEFDKRIAPETVTPEVCACGKTVLIDSFGDNTGNTCPQCGEFKRGSKMSFTALNPDGSVHSLHSFKVGANTELIDARESANFNEDEGGRWVTVCKDHDQFVQHATKKTAKDFVDVPIEWCETCMGNETVAKTSAKPLSEVEFTNYTYDPTEIVRMGDPHPGEPVSALLPNGAVSPVWFREMLPNGNWLCERHVSYGVEQTEVVPDADETSWELPAGRLLVEGSKTAASLVKGASRMEIAESKLGGKYSIGEDVTYLGGKGPEDATIMGFRHGAYSVTVDRDGYETAIDQVPEDKIVPRGQMQMNTEASLDFMLGSK